MPFQTSGKTPITNEGRVPVDIEADNIDFATEDSVASIKTACEAINTALQTAGITQVQLAAIKTALETIDNAISGNEMQVDVISSALPSGASTEATLAKLPGLSIPIHDEIVLSYTGDNLTGVVYKLATVTVATLTLSYTGSNLTGVVKT